MGGFSAKGNAGRRDLTLEKDGTTLAAIEAVMCRNPTTHKSTREDLTKHFRKLLGYSTGTLFFHITYSFVDDPASVLQYLKHTAENDALNGFTYIGLEDIPVTDARPAGFSAYYKGAIAPVKVIFLVLDMLQHAQRRTAQVAGRLDSH